MRPAPALLVALALTAAPAGCKRPYEVGDHVLVEWEGKPYPAMIVKVEGPSKFRVHYDCCDETWDETVTRDRIKGRAPEGAVSPEPPAKVRAKAIAASQTNVYKVGDRVRVEWHGTLYPAVIIAIVGQERYRVHFEGYGNEWDDTVGLARIQPRR